MKKNDNIWTKWFPFNTIPCNSKLKWWCELNSAQPTAKKTKLGENQAQKRTILRCCQVVGNDEMLCMNYEPYTHLTESKFKLAEEQRQEKTEKRTNEEELSVKM